MPMLGLDSKVSGLEGIGKVLAKRLSYLGIGTLRDLVFYFPFRYENYRTVKVSGLVPGTFANVSGEVEMIAAKRTKWKRRYVVEAMISDGTGSVKAVWFNQPWIAKSVRSGQKIRLSGKVGEDMSGPYFNSPTYLAGEGRMPDGIVPIYPLTEGLTQKQLRALMNQAFSNVRTAEYLSPDLLKAERFMGLEAALRQVHFPDSEAALVQARQRLAFDELFLMQAASRMLRKELDRLKSPTIPFDEKANKKFVQSLSFDLTLDQKRAAWEIIRDLGKETPMNRMLEGDVGSGKTIVALMAAYNAGLAGYQSALMAPTEILASQHYDSARKILGKFMDVALLTRTRKSVNGEKVTAGELLELVSSGKIGLVIGTHALIQEKVSFGKLALAMVDEQHRFGVEQRQALRGKADTGDGLVPHFLSLTATPIPRSLALICYGDLDLSIIRQMPKGRKRIITKVVGPADRERAYGFVREQVAAGRQVFVICPLIDPSDVLGYKSAVEEYERLDKEVFPNLKIGLLHGRMKSEEKESVMADFCGNKLGILVATSVVEVGVDVPNATVMMIEGAERFGLAQLHQFRGRVGRGEHQSYCLLFSEALDVGVMDRLQYVADCHDGFDLANRDLELRGGGSAYSTKQSGFTDLKIADIKDAAAIKKAQDWAKRVIDDGDEKLITAIKSQLDMSGFTSHRE